MSEGPIDENEALARLRSDDPSAQYYAAWWLGRNRSRHPEALPLLLSALQQRRPRDPGAGVEENAVARNAARALGKLGDPEAIPELLAALDQGAPFVSGPMVTDLLETPVNVSPYARGQLPLYGWTAADAA